MALVESMKCPVHGTVAIIVAPSWTKQCGKCVAERRQMRIDAAKQQLDDLGAPDVVVLAELKILREILWADRLEAQADYWERVLTAAKGMK